MGKVINYRPYRKIEKRKKRKKRDIHPLLVVLIFIAIGSVYYFVRNGEDIIEVSNNNSVYNTIESGLLNNQTEIMVSTRDDAEKIYEEAKRALNAHPELFWATGGFSLTSMPNMALPTYMLKINSRCDQDDIPQMMTSLNESVDSIVDAANAKYDSDYEKAAFVHDFIVLNCTYDVDTFNKYLNNSNDETSLAYTSYGCLVNRKAVCTGYSKAYKLILNRLNIECEVVSGTAANDMRTGNHAWNYIKLDDGYYLVDVTWDDPVSFDGTQRNEVRRDYFCLNSEMMSKDHFPDEDEEVPYCDGKRYLAPGY